MARHTSNRRPTTGQQEATPSSTSPPSYCANPSQPMLHYDALPDGFCSTPADHLPANTSGLISQQTTVLINPEDKQILTTPSPSLPEAAHLRGTDIEAAAAPNNNRLNAQAQPPPLAARRTPLTHFLSLIDSLLTLLALTAMIPVWLLILRRKEHDRDCKAARVTFFFSSLIYGLFLAVSCLVHDAWHTRMGTRLGARSGVRGGPWFAVCVFVAAMALHASMASSCFFEEG